MGDDTDRLVRWLCDNGVNLDQFPLTLATFGGAGNGFIASRDIQADEVLVAIPSKLLLAPASIKNTTLSIITSNPQYALLKENVALCLVLVFERFLANNSFWDPYFPMLPEGYSISANFTEDELQMLQNESTIQEARNQKETMLAAYERVRSLLQGVGEITQEQFVWAWGVVQTRACYQTTDMNAHSMLLVPWADFLNHSTEVDTIAYLDKKDDSYKMVTKTPFNKGDQVFISYGKHGNPDLLHYYGFSIDSNPNDVVVLDIAQSPLIQNNIKLQSATNKHKFLSHQDKLNKQLWATKENILTENGLGIYGKFTAQLGDSPISWNLQTVLRILMANSTEIDKKLHLNVFNDEMVSPRNEVEVCNFLINLAAELLKNYKTTTEEDNALLGGTKLSFVARCIVITRKQEKQILEYLIHHCRTIISSIT